MTDKLKQWHKNAADAVIGEMANFCGFPEWWGMLDEEASEAFMFAISQAIADNAPESETHHD